jgi:hypothetical protein
MSCPRKRASSNHRPIALAPGELTLALDSKQCYIVTNLPLSTREPLPMPTHVHPQHHHHPAGQGHPPASISPSILRMSVLERLAIAAALAAALWAAVIWAMTV